MSISLSNAISGRREPKRANRWVLKFETVPYPATLSVPAGGLSNGADTMAESLAIDLLSASRPHSSLNSDTVTRLSEQWHFATHPTWDPITVSFYDFDSGQGSAMQILWRWYQTVYDVLNGTMGYAATYKVDASLILLGPGQTSTQNAATTNVQIIEAWDLFGCYPNGITPGALSYETNDSLKVEMDMIFDYASLHTTTDTGGAGGTWNSIA